MNRRMWWWVGGCVVVVGVGGLLGFCSSGQESTPTTSTTAPAVITVDPKTPSPDQTSSQDAGTAGALSDEELEHIASSLEKVDLDAGIVVLSDINGGVHQMPLSDVYTRQGLVEELGWSSADVLGDASAFTIGSQFLTAATSTHYQDGGAQSLHQAQQWAAGAALELVQAWEASVIESGPSVGEVSAQEITTSLVTMTYAPRTLADVYGPTTRDRVVLLAHYQLRSSTAGQPISERDTVLVVERIDGSWKVTDWPQIDLGSGAQEPGVGD